MNLDAYSLSLALAAAVVVQIAVLFFQSRQVGGYRGAGRIALGLTVIAVGLMFTALLKNVLPTRVLGPVGATFVHGGVVVLSTGVMRLMSLPERRLLLVGLFLLYFCGVVAHWLTNRNLIMQVSNMLGFAGYMSVTAFAIFRAKRRNRETSGLVIGFLFALMAAMFSIRAIRLLVLGSDGSLDKPGAFFAIMYLVILAGSLLFSFAVITLINQRALGDLNQVRDELTVARDRAQAAVLRKEAALEEARRSSDAKSRFLAAMSHELRTPMHGILGMVRNILDSPGGPRDREWLTRVIASGEHLLNIINEILDHSQLENEQIKIRDARLDIAGLVKEAHKVALLEAERKGLECHIEGEIVEPLWIRGDAGRIRQVIVNLLGNAVKFTERGHVILELKHDSENVVIRVSDTGPGIPEPERERIFAPFFQVDGGRTRKYGGTGLGLALARDLARAMHGDLRVAEHVVGGAIFYFQFPYRPAEESEATAPAAVDLHPLKGRVLLAEDDESSALLARTMLERMHLETELAGNGEAAFMRYQAERPDIILMDNQMPGMDGMEATRRIRGFEKRSGHAPVPIIGLTADAFEEDRRACLAAGMNEHLAKPFRKEQLWSVLARYLPEQKV